MSKTSYKERARQRREEEILRTAARLIRERGYANLNMDELAEEVGISKPTLYQHFSGKDDMVLKTMLQSIQRMEKLITDVDGDTALVKLTNVMRHMLTVHADPDGYSIAIVRESNLALRHLRDETSEVNQIQQRVGYELYELVAEARKEGAIYPDVSNVLVIGAMFSALAMLESPAIMRERDTNPTDLIDSIIAYFMRGISPIPYTAT